MAKILIGATGSVAAIRVPQLYEELLGEGHDVKVVATDAATYFFDPLAIGSNGKTRNRDEMILDEDEWPGRTKGKRFKRNDRVLHIELRNWADLFAIAPLDANTLAKLAAGLCDNCLTCVWRAWDVSKPVILAPAMNTLMWEHSLTQKHLQAVLAQFDAEGDRLRIVPPIEKELACGDVGVGAMAEVPAIVKAVQATLRRVG